MALSGAAYDEIDKLKGQILVLIRDTMRFCERYNAPEPGWLDGATLTAQDLQDELDRRNAVASARPVDDDEITRPIKPARRMRAAAGGRKKKG